MGIFEKRVNFKPFEYPDFIDFMKAIRHSYWLEDEWNFISDIQDFNVNLTETEKSVVKNAVLAISQIEVNVKTFWADVYKYLPKPEVAAVGYTFAESEVRHSFAYAQLLEKLNLNNEFERVGEIPAIQDRVDYLSKYLKNAGDGKQESYTLTLALFSLFIEFVSLFSQFLILKSFYKYKNQLKDLNNTVQATQKEELIHGFFGAKLIQIIKTEYPEWFNDEFTEKIIRACKKAYKAELKIIDWIFENGELDTVSKSDIDEFIKDRFNQALGLIEMEPIFETKKEVLDKLSWFDDEIYLTTSYDFFNKKSTNYSKRSKSVKKDDIFNVVV